MRKVINLTKNPRQIIEHILVLYRDNMDILQLHRGEEEYTVKYSFSDGGVIVADVKVAPECYRFHVEQEASVLMNRKPAFPPFDCGLSVNGNSIRYHSTPYQKDAREWLREREVYNNSNTTHADALIMIATVCSMIWSFLLPCMKVREYGDTVEYSPVDNFITVVDEYVVMLRKNYKKEHRLDGWDVVNLTTNQMKKLGETLEQHQIKHDFDNIALPKFCLALYNPPTKSTLYYFITYMGKKIHFVVEDDRSENASAYCDISIERTPNDELSLTLEDDTNAMTWLTNVETAEDGEQVTHWQWMVDAFYSVNSFMLHFGDVTMEVETKEAIAPSESKPNKHHKDRKNSVRLFKSYKLIKNWKSQARKKAEITCPAWGVRGHFRHYRNGKTVFIEPFIKGRDKALYKGKEYALLPYKDA